MREHVHDTTMRFRANSVLAQQAEQVARREGMSVSEFIRFALRRAVREAA